MDTLLHPLSGSHRVEGPQQVGTDTWRRLKHKHTAGTQEVDWQTWCDLHGEEKPELWVWVEGMQLLLQLYKPARRQVDVLQHHPPAAM